MRRNTLAIGGGVVILIVAALAYFAVVSPSRAIGDDVRLTAFTSGGEEFGRASVSLPSLIDGQAVVNVAVDANNDGTFSEGEWVVRNAHSNLQEDWRSNYYFSYEGDLRDEINGLVLISEDEVAAGSLDTPPSGTESKSVAVAVDFFEIGELLDLSTVTNPEESMKGLGVSVAQAQDTHISTAGVPDISQRAGECAPTSAANSLISLINQNGTDEQKPGDPAELIDELKKDMNWTPQNGVLPDDFVRGKNTWAARNGIPIRTKKVGDANGISTLDEIRNALENGDAVELRIKFGDPSTGKAVGGHMVTVTGMHVDGDEVSIEINDPASPEGTDAYEINGNQITSYPFRGWTVLSWGFVQTWEGDPTGAGFDTLTDEEISGIRGFVGEKTAIKVIRYGNKYLPVSQLTSEDEEGCEGGKAHWHASQGGSVTATDGTAVPDPGPQCGYGTLETTPVMDLEIETPDSSRKIKIEGGIFGN